MKKTIIRIILALLILAIIGIYVYDIIANQTPPSKHIFRTLSVTFLCVASLIRISGASRQSLEYYDQQYSDILRDAFAQDPLWRNKLLCAVRLYNESNYDKALKYLADMKKRCQTGPDHYAVNLFAALCFTDLELYEQAENVYRQLINMQLENSRIYSNLGHVQIKAGEYKKALCSYERALDYDRDNAYAYNNIAQAHFQMHEFPEAIPFALKALEINPKMHQASALLAIIYTLEGDRENSEKYFHIAISSGRNPKELQESIEYYRSAKHTMDKQNPVSPAEES